MKIDTLRTLQLEANGIGPDTDCIYDYMTLDAKVARGYPCQICGGEMTYAAVLNHGTYRAFAVCEVCGCAYEF